MNYIALLRGINAGKNRRVDMKRLAAVFAAAGYTGVSTYINSGNVFFESDKKQESVRRDIEAALVKAFGFEIPTLVKTAKEMRSIAEAIPAAWQNDDHQRTDVAYLFKQADSPKIIDSLPLRKEFVDIRYVKGAVLWNLDRKYYSKSHLNKLIGHPAYQLMTMRNVNTARFLGGIDD